MRSRGPVHMMSFVTGGGGPWRGAAHQSPNRLHRFTLPVPHTQEPNVHPHTTLPQAMTSAGHTLSGLTKATPEFKTQHYVCVLHARGLVNPWSLRHNIKYTT
ncbi:unnamed protein product [Arctogadus glacialis]